MTQRSQPIITTKSSPATVIAGGEGTVRPGSTGLTTSGNDAAPKEASQPTSADIDDVYREVCANIRATDEISLKLLAAVPLATGIGISLLVTTSTKDLPGIARSFLSLFAAVIAFAIYRWERKNIASCGHYRQWASVLERGHFKIALPATETDAPGTYPHGRVPAPAFLNQSWGKTRAEILLYWTVIISWLATSIYTLIR